MTLKKVELSTQLTGVCRYLQPPQVQAPMPKVQRDTSQAKG
jgi:hypothetical protein